ncbi:MAG: diguanylate cyclase [Myxococcota bacterium]
MSTDITLELMESVAELGTWTYVAEGEGRVFLSRGARVLVGGNPKTLNALAACLPQSSDVFRRLVRTAHEHGDAFRHRAQISGRNGSPVWLEFRGVPRHDAHGVPTVVGSVQDVTEVSRREGRLEELSRLLRQAEAMARVGHWHWDVASDRVYWSDEVYRIFGFDRDEDAPDFGRVLNAYTREDGERLQGLVARAVSEGEAYDFSGTLESGRRVRAKGEPQFDKQGEVVGVFGVIQETTEDGERALHLERLRHAVEHTANGVLVADRDGVTVWANRGFEALTGFASDEIVGRKPGRLLQGPETDGDTIRRISDALHRGEAVSTEILNYKKSGEPFWIHLAIHPRRDERGVVQEYIAIETDITDQVEAREALTKRSKQLKEAVFRLQRQKDELEWLATRESEVRRALEKEAATRAALHEELRRAATRDALTGIPNRRAFMEEARAAFAHHERYASQLSLVLIDIDHFKGINDRHGHAVGDAVLKHVAGVLEGALRRPTDVLGRIGGEEFAVLLRDTDYAGATVLAERVRRRLESSSLCLDEGTVVQATCSLGVAAANTADDSVEKTIARADAALYRAKAGGRNRWVVDDGHHESWPVVVSLKAIPKPRAANE